MLVVHVYGPAPIKVPSPVLSVPVFEGLPVATALVTSPALSVAVVEMDGRLAGVLASIVASKDNDLVAGPAASIVVVVELATSCLLPTLERGLVSKLAVESCSASFALVLVLALFGLLESPEDPSCTGHRLQTPRLASQ